MPPFDVGSCQLLQLASVHDQRGNLTFVEGGKHVPFKIRRVYYLHDVPGGESRAGHAHRALEQILVAVAGSFDVVLDDGKRRDKVTLNRPSVALFLPRLVWREIENFSSGAVCLALASDYFDETDYIREYAEFIDEVTA